MNDTSTTGDSFTSAIGSSGNTGSTPASPKRFIDQVIASAAPGDTIFVDSGVFSETLSLVFSSPRVALIGVDSVATIIDFNDTTAGGAKAIKATDMDSYTIRNLRIRQGFNGIYFRDVKGSLIQSVHLDSNGQYGVFFDTTGLGSCDSNMISGCYATRNQHGVSLFGADLNTITNMRAESNTLVGFNLLSNCTSNVIIGNFAIANTSQGFNLSNGSNNNILANNKALRNGTGILINMANGNSLNGDTCTSNTSDGITLQSSNGNIVTGNTSSQNADALGLTTSSNGNVISGNTFSANNGDEIYLVGTSTGNAFTNNVITNSFANGVYLSSSSNNTFRQNTFDSNAGFAFFVDAGCSSETFEKNVVTISAGRPDSGILNNTLNRVDADRNFWGTTDTVALKAKIWGQGRDSVIYTPFRLGIVDTSVGGDTVAPKAPDTVSTANTGPTTLRVSWAAVTTNEETTPIAVGLNGYRIYRSQKSDTTQWIQRGAVAGTAQIFDDSGLTSDTNYFYRVTSVDAATYVNESFLSDSIANGMPTIDTSGPNAWYVNDSSTVGDSFTSTVGNDANSGLSISAPKRNLHSVGALLTPGDSIYVDAGVFDSYVIVTNGITIETAVIFIDTNNVTLIGKDSVSTILDPPGPSTLAGNYGVFADTQTGLTIRNIAARDAFNGIRFYNVDASTIQSDSTYGNGDDGIFIGFGSDTNTIINNYSRGNVLHGICLNSASCSNTVSGNVTPSDSGNGINIIEASNRNTVIGNVSGTNTLNGIYIDSSANNTVFGNTFNGNVNHGILITTGANNNTVTNNTASSNLFMGINVTASSGNIMIGNSTISNALNGVQIGSTSNIVSGGTSNTNGASGIVLGPGSGNTVSGCTTIANSQSGIVITSSSFDTLINNIANSNVQSGINILTGGNHIVAGNTANSNSESGISMLSAFSSTVSNNVMTLNRRVGAYLSACTQILAFQNTFDSNGQYQIHIDKASFADTFTKNNIKMSPTNPESATLNLSSAASDTFYFTRNFWNSTDSLVIRGRVFSNIGSITGDSIIYTPFRLGLVDTAPGADTVAPKAPDTVTATFVSTSSLRVDWTSVIANEEPASGAVGLNGYRVYRSQKSDTTQWIQRGATNASTATFTDTGLTADTVYLYRVTSVDAAPFVNESFLSDSIASGTTSIDTSGPNIWYVNDTSTVGDSFTSAIGSDGNSGLSISAPKRTINAVIPFLTAGDTILIDAGTYTESIAISTSSIFLIGKDSVSTVINAGDSSAANAVNVIVVSAANGVVRDLQVRDGYRGLKFLGTTNCVADRVTARRNSFAGIAMLSGSGHRATRCFATQSDTIGFYVDSNCDSVTLETSVATSNGSNGFELWRSIGSNWYGNTASGNNGGFQIRLSRYDTFSANTATGNTGRGFVMDQSCSHIVLAANTASSNSGAGFFVQQSSLNSLAFNTASSNTGEGFEFDTAPQNTISSNTSANNGSVGFYLTTCDSNTITGNTSTTDSTAGFALETCGYNVVRSNTATLSLSSGFAFLRCTQGVISNNSSTNNRLDGITIFGTSGCTFTQNTLDSNGGWAFNITDTYPGSQYLIALFNTIQKNDMSGRPGSPDSVVRVAQPQIFTADFRRNFWGTTDTAAIKAKISGIVRDSVIFTPFRLGIVDTSVGADTVAPKAPDTVSAAILSATSLRISWASVSTNEEPASVVGLNGYRIYRSQRSDTSQWIQRGAVGAAALSFDDTGLTSDTAYFYRVTSVDAATIENQSFLSDSIASGTPTIDTSGPNVWYVNDSSTVGDSFTSAIGNDANTGLSISTPKRNIQSVAALLTQGDTVYIDAGVYDSYVNPSATETAVFKIDTNSIWIIGVDSKSTILDPPGDSNQGGLYGIYADTQEFLTIRNLGIGGTHRGIFFINVDTSIIRADSVTAGGAGIFLINGSDSNLIGNNILTAKGGIGDGIQIASGAFNAITGNTSNLNASDGIEINGGSKNTIMGNVTNSNVSQGVNLSSSSSNNTVSNNTANSNSVNGIDVNSSSTNVLSGNTTSFNAGIGINLTNSSNNTISGNTANSNANYGIEFGGGGGSTGNTVTSNTTNTNGLRGLNLDGGSNGNFFVSNISNFNLSAGALLNLASSNIFVGNTFSSNASYGVFLNIASNNNTFVQNTFDSNGQYQFYNDGGSGDIAQKNNIRTSPSNADSGVLNNTSNVLTFTRNFWNVLDTVAIRRMVVDTSGVNRITYTPFRLGIVDTAPGADTTAPKAPDTVTATSPTETTIRIAWTAVTTLEEPNGGAVGLAGYRVYRANTPDSSFWILRGAVGAATTTFDDSGLTVGDSKYYRVTSFDAATFENQSFFSDSIANATTIDVTPPTAPSITAPVSPHDTRATAITFTWTASTDAGGISGYRLQIDTQPTFNTLLVDSFTTLTTGTRTLATDSRYFVRVVAVDNSLNTAASSTLRLQLDSVPPSKPVSIQPPADHDTTVTTVNFIWGSSIDTGVGVLRYHLQIAVDTAFLSIIVDSITGTVITSGTRTLAAGTYFWRAVAEDSVGNTVAGDTRRITVTTVSGPTTPILIGPAASLDTVSHRIIFSWNASVDTSSTIDHYQLDISSSPTISSPTVTHTCLSTSATRFLTTGIYYWRVLVQNALGVITYSETRQLTISNPAGGLAAPAFGMYIPDTVVAFSWTPTGDTSSIARYVLQASSDPSFTSLAVSAMTVGATPARTVTGMGAGTWYWKYAAQDASGNVIGLSNPFIFTIETAPAPQPGIIIPSQNSITRDEHRTFSWVDTGVIPTSGVDGFELEIKRGSVVVVDSYFVTPLTMNSFNFTNTSETYYTARVRTKTVAGNFGPFSSPISFAYDATPPAGAPNTIFPVGGSETTVTAVTFKVSDVPDTGPGGSNVRYHFEASRSPSFAGVVTSQIIPTATSTFTPLYVFNDSGSYYWRAAAVDAAGNEAAFSAPESFRRPSPPSNPATDPPPIAPSDLSASANDQLGITITWRKSPSADMASGGQYNIYWNAGDDSRIPDALFKIVSHSGAESYSFTTSTETTLQNGLLYRFKVRAQDRAGLEDRNDVIVGSFARFFAANLSHAEITSPDAGEKVQVSGQVLVQARVSSDFRNQADTILFQFRSLGGGTWSKMRVSSVGNSKNPQTIAGSDRAAYGMHWDAASDLAGLSGGADTMVEIRAIVTDKFGNRSTQLSSVQGIRFAASENDAEFSSSAGTDTARVKRKVDARRENHLTVDADGDLTVSLTFPEGSLAETTDTSDARLTADGSKAARTASATGAAAGRGAGPSGLAIGSSNQDQINAAIGAETPVGMAVSIALPEGQTTLRNGLSARLTFTYPVLDGDGFVPGTRCKPEDLIVRAASAGDLDSRILTIASIDTVNRTITALTNRFSSFVLIAPAAGSGGPGNQANLSRFMLYPNPFRPNDGNAATGSPFNAALPRSTGIVFDNLPPRVRIEIYSLNGERVFDRSTTVNDGFVTWNVQNSGSGRDVASGYYIYIVTDLATNQRVTGKLAVLR